MEQEIQEVIDKIKGLDEAALALAKEHQAGLDKPVGSLGKLEDISIRLAGITGKVNNDILKRRIIVLCADNGILEEGVSCTPRSDTAAQAARMTRGKTAMSSMAEYFGDDTQIVDIGIADPYDPKDILKANIRKGTANILKEDAMTRSECIDAILVGVKLAKLAHEHRINAVGVGAMGAGNTATGSAVLSVLAGLGVEELMLRKDGLSDESLMHKAEVITEAIKRRNPDKDDVIDVISKVGGLDIAAMCGVYLGCARERIPVVIDGFVSLVAALCAARIAPLSKEFMFPSHESFDPAYQAAVKELGIEPYFNMGIRLGEGSGCVLTFEIMTAACSMTNDMARSDEY